MLNLSLQESESWFSILSLFAPVSSDRNSHLCSSCLAPKPNSGHLSQLCPHDLHHPGRWLSQVFWPPLWNILTLFCLLSSAMRTPTPCPLTLLRPSKYHCLYVATWHSNLVFPQAKFNHLFHKFWVFICQALWPNKLAWFLPYGKRTWVEEEKIWRYNFHMGYEGELCAMNTNERI